MKNIDLLELLNLSKIEVSDENKLEEIKKDGSLSVEQLSKLFKGDSNMMLIFLREYFKKYRNEIIKEDEFEFLMFLSDSYNERVLGEKQRDEYPNEYQHDNVCIQEMCFQYSEYLLNKYGNSVTKKEYYSIRKALLDCDCDWRQSEIIVDFFKKYKINEYNIEESDSSGFFNGLYEKYEKKGLYIGKKDKFQSAPLELGDVLIINEKKYTIVAILTLDVPKLKVLEDGIRQMPFLIRSKDIHDSVFAIRYIILNNIPLESKEYYYVDLWCFE